MSVQIVLFDGFDPLDVIAPFEVFVAGSEYFLDNALDITLVSAEGARDVVSGSQGLRLRATAALDPHRPGIVLDITRLLAELGVNLESLTTSVAPAPMSSESLFHADALLAVPLSLTLEVLQSKLETLADDLMVELRLRTEA